MERRVCMFAAASVAAVWRKDSELLLAVLELLLAVQPVRVANFALLVLQLDMPEFLAAHSKIDRLPFPPLLCYSKKEALEKAWQYLV